MSRGLKRNLTADGQCVDDEDNRGEDVCQYRLTGGSCRVAQLGHHLKRATITPAYAWGLTL